MTRTCLHQLLVLFILLNVGCGSPYTNNNEDGIGLELSEISSEGEELFNEDTYQDTVEEVVDLLDVEDETLYSKQDIETDSQPCVPNCVGKECGHDGCGGICGVGCGYGYTCNQGKCELLPCIPNCEGKECGSDGCGDECGPGCDDGFICIEGKCEPIPCIPNCEGKECGPDGCGGICGVECGDGYICNQGKCELLPCVPNCVGKECGSDGCGNQCGPGCDDGFICTNGKCEPTPCIPNCAGKECGPDGCGGKCMPGCSSGQTCQLGKCGKVCVHTYGGVYANGGCSPSYQCCDGVWKKGNEVCGPCVCKESTGKIGCLPGEEPQPEPEGFSFVVYGDTQFATNSCTSGVPERLAVPKVISALNPTFVLHTGDLMDHGYEAGAYAQFEKCSQSFASKYLFFPTPGNHDMGSGAILAFKKYLENRLFSINKSIWGAGYDTLFNISYNDDPTNYSTDFNKPSDKKVVPSGVSFKTFYSFKYKTLTVISFEQGTRWWTNTPIPWVEKHLKMAHDDPTNEYIVVLMHHPMYSTTMPEKSDGECIEPVRKHYESLFQKYNVTMVFAGHAHLYEHFFVPDDFSYTKADPHPSTYKNDGNSIHYFVTGGGGGPLNPCNPPLQEKSINYSQGRFCAYHVIQVKVNKKEMFVKVIKVKGNADNYTTQVADEFSLVKP